MSSDREWQKWGSIDPYFGVLSTEEFRDGGNRAAFLQAGVEHLEGLRAQFSQRGIPLEASGSALDFGCGVGRVLGPMSRFFGASCGIDIAAGMLAEAAKNAPDAELRLFDGNDFAATLGDSSFHFVHSALVLQHIPVRRGLEYLEHLCAAVAPGGRMMIQAPIFPKNPWRHRASQTIKANPLLCKVSRLLLLRPRPFDPVMQMNVYSAKALLPLWAHHGLQVRGLETSPDGDLWQGWWYLCKPAND